MLDEQTHHNSIYLASIASRGKMLLRVIRIDKHLSHGGNVSETDKYALCLDCMAGIGRNVTGDLHDEYKDESRSLQPALTRVQRPTSVMFL